LSLTKKNLSPIHEEGKTSQEGSVTGPLSKAERQGSEQTGRTLAEPCLEHNITNSPKTGPRTSTETGPRTISKPGSPNNQAEYDNRPAQRTWKHEKSHPS